ncbi:MAG: hypothetical protein AAFQ47_16710, partial [Pseudomonadota bacterium]
RTVILVYVRGRTSHTRDVVLRDLDNGRVKGVASRMRSGVAKKNQVKSSENFPKNSYKKPYVPGAFIKV